MIHFSIQTGLTKLSKKGFRSGSGIYFICSNKPQKKCPFDNAMEGVESFWSNAQMERVTIWMGLPPNQPGDTQSHPIPNPQSHIQLRLHFFMLNNWTPSYWTDVTFLVLASAVSSLLPSSMSSSLPTWRELPERQNKDCHKFNNFILIKAFFFLASFVFFADIYHCKYEMKMQHNENTLISI